MYHIATGENFPIITVILSIQPINVTINMKPLNYCLTDQHIKILNTCSLIAQATKKIQLQCIHIDLFAK